MTKYQLSTTKTDLIHPLSHLHPSQLRQKVWAVGHGGAGESLDLLHNSDGYDWLVLSAKYNIAKNEKCWM